MPCPPLAGSVVDEMTACRRVKIPLSPPYIDESHYFDMLSSLHIPTLLTPHMELQARQV